MDVDFRKLKDLCSTLNSYLSVNGWKDNGPVFEDMTIEDFQDYVEKRSEEEIFPSDIKVEMTERTVLSRIYRKKDDKNTRLFVFFSPEESKDSVSKCHVEDFLKLCIKLDCKHGLIISPKKLTPKGQEKIDESNIPALRNEESSKTAKNVFHLTSYIDEDFIDLTKLAMGTNIKKIYKGKEARDFLKDNGIKAGLPQLRIDRPICKFYGASVGDIVCTIRETGVPGTFIDTQLIYRQVKNVPRMKKGGKRN